MIPIYICEDNEIYLNQIKSEIENYIMIQNFDMNIEYATHDPIELLEYLKKNNSNGIYFLDVDLKNDALNGFKLAKEIRQLDTRGFIIFVTTHSELSFETFRYRLEAMDYITKDDIQNIQVRIRQCLDSVQERISKQSDDNKEYYSIKVLNEVYNIIIDDIYSIETSNLKHRLILTSENQQLEYYGSLNEVENELDDKFIRIHRSFLINNEKIESIDIKNNTLTLINGQVCIIARGMKKKIKELILNT